MKHLPHHLKDMQRVKEVVTVLFHEGLGYFIDKMKLRWHLPLHKNMQFHKFCLQEHPPLQVRLRRSMEKLGGTFVKLGQLLSLRPDLVPRSYCEEFSKLQDQVKPLPFPLVKKVVEQELGKTLNTVFSSFDEKALGSASVGQVHRATLKNGKQVVVKVQRPNIAEIFREDIDILYYLFGKWDKYHADSPFQLLRIIEEFEAYTKRELDYQYEKRNLIQFEKAFQHHHFIKIPHVYPEFCTSKVLVMECVPGKKLSELLSSSPSFPKTKIAKTLVETALTQVFDSPIFHADLHPGNILLTPHGKVCLLDFGIVGSLDDELRKKGIDLFLAIMNQDSKAVVANLLKIGIVQGNFDEESLRRDIHEILSQWHGTTLSEVRVTSMLHRIFDACLMHHLILSTDLILLGKALVTAEGTCLKLDPQFDFAKVAQPYLAFFLHKKIKQSLHPKNVIKEALLFKEILQKIPAETLEVLETLKKGKLRIDLAQDEFSFLTQELDRSSNRVSYAVLIASFILAGSLLAVSGLGKPVLGIPLFAFLSFSFAGLVGIFLVFSIIKEGRWNKIHKT